MKTTIGLICLFLVIVLLSGCGAGSQQGSVVQTEHDVKFTYVLAHSYTGWGTAYYFDDRINQLVAKEISEWQTAHPEFVCTKRTEDTCHGSYSVTLEIQRRDLP